MKSTIENGMTIINMKPQSTKRIYEVPSGYSVEISLKGKNYYLGTVQTYEEAEALKNEAQQHKDNGTFHDWYATKNNTRNRYGVKGLKRDHKTTGSFRLTIMHKKITYSFLFKDVESAAEFRKIADEQLKKGTFPEWAEEYKKYSNIINKK